MKFHNILYVFFTLLPFLYSQSFNNLHLSSGSCILHDTSIYYFGGRVADSSITSYFPNQKVYSLNLNEDLKLSNSKGNWKEYYKLSDKFDLIYNQLFLVNKSQLISFGGQSNNTILQSFNIQKKVWSIDEKFNNKFIKLLNEKVINNRFFINSFSIAQNDLNEYEFIWLNGEYNQPNMKLDKVEPIMGLFKFNYLTGEIKKEEVNVDYGINQKSFFYQGEYYYFAGNNVDDQPYSLNNIKKINFQQKKVSIIKPKGKLPLISDFKNIILNNHTLYLINEYIVNTTIQLNSNQTQYLYQLNLKTFTWQQYHILGFESKENACLIYFNNYLVYSFGGYKGIADQFTQIIDLNLLKKVDKFNNTNVIINNNNDKNSNNSNNNSNNNNNNNLITYILISIIILIILIIIIIYKYKSNLFDYFQLKQDKNIPNIILEPEIKQLSFTLDKSSIKFRHSALSDNQLDHSAYLIPYTYLPKN